MVCILNRKNKEREIKKQLNVRKLLWNKVDDQKNTLRKK